MTHKLKGTLTLSPAGTPTVNNTLFVASPGYTLRWRDNAGKIIDLVGVGEVNAENILRNAMAIQVLNYEVGIGKQGYDTLYVDTFDVIAGDDADINLTTTTAGYDAVNKRYNGEFVYDEFDDLVVNLTRWAINGSVSENGTQQICVGNPSPGGGALQGDSETKTTYHNLLGDSIKFSSTLTAYLNSPGNANFGRIMFNTDGAGGNTIIDEVSTTVAGLYTESHNYELVYDSGNNRYDVKIDSGHSHYIDVSGATYVKIQWIAHGDSWHPTVSGYAYTYTSYVYSCPATTHLYYNSWTTTPSNITSVLLSANKTEPSGTSMTAEITADGTNWASIDFDSELFLANAGAVPNIRFTFNNDVFNYVFASLDDWATGWRY